MVEKVTVERCVNELHLDVISGKEYLNREITRTVVSQPGVEIYSNYFEFYEDDRIQVLGTKEVNLFYMLKEDERLERARKLFSYNPPVFIFTIHVEEVPPQFIQASEEYKIPILKSKQRTTAFITTLSSYLSEELAEKKSVHGVMLDINGVGVLLRGKSFVGKSETALELLKRGHALVSDDLVDLVRKDEFEVIASSPKLTEKLMEIRGLGIVDVVDLFGVKAFRNKKRVMLIVDLVKWDEHVTLDRLGLEQEMDTYFDVKIPKVTIHVQPGRNLATLIEVAAMNWRLKSFGRNASLEFVNKLNNIVRNNKKES